MPEPIVSGTYDPLWKVHMIKSPGQALCLLVLCLAVVGVVVLGIRLGWWRDPYDGDEE